MIRPPACREQTCRVWISCQLGSTLSSAVLQADFQPQEFSSVSTRGPECSPFSRSNWGMWVVKCQGRVSEHVGKCKNRWSNPVTDKTVNIKEAQTILLIEWFNPKWKLSLYLLVLQFKIMGHLHFYLIFELKKQGHAVFFYEEIKCSIIKKYIRITYVMNQYIVKPFNKYDFDFYLFIYSHARDNAHSSTSHCS